MLPPEERKSNVDFALCEIPYFEFEGNQPPKITVLPQIIEQNFGDWNANFS